ncbi:hypothetical protein C8F04DRAFT_1181076 [Mycena alexandri]|uniref:Uncharacterized protein n=1 Tax=Mycena alexandri TaxID=1745969 RepID=A0AAD6X6G8_9AGAR|nr:hypothetical protein C8F04DRAFT_1181076 [Mycena alexandri]
MSNSGTLLDKVMCKCRRKCGGPDGPGNPVAYSTWTSHKGKDIAKPSAQFSEFTPEVPVPVGLDGDDKDAVPTPKVTIKIVPQTQGTKMTPTAGSNTARNLCAKAWCTKHPGGLTSQYKMYWDSIKNTDEGKIWAERSAAAIQAKKDVRPYTLDRLNIILIDTSRRQKDPYGVYAVRPPEGFTFKCPAFMQQLILHQSTVKIYALSFVPLRQVAYLQDLLKRERSAMSFTMALFLNASGPP